MQPNRLIRATSPYLLQHAHNPVDWYPWGPEALKVARDRDQPILLSIGYAACHWCHVMAHESFDDPFVAAIMNRDFVNIKVDREERPDLDGIYMDAVQTMTGQGGWPMTVFLTPDGHPFVAGTYFPPDDRPGLPSFRTVLEAVARAWRERREEILAHGQQMSDRLAGAASLPESSEPLTEDILGAATKWLGSNFDSRWGGFGLAPKFPQPMLLEFLLGEHLAGDPDALTMVTTTLDRMAAGGIHDQLGGGFHRYSTDERWLVPHFEKMLYDNAQLARVYLHAFQVTGRDRYREVTVSTLEYLLGEMRHPAGGFFSSQDADSEGEEGRFFVWSQADILAAAQAHGTAVAAYFGTEPQGNWDGTNVLWTPNELAVVAASHSVSLDELKRSVERTRSALIQTRSARVRPSTDDKVLAGWNGLVIIALAEAGRCLGNSDYISAATKACHFVLDQMRDESGKLARSWREGDRGGPAYLDDYALMASACLTLYQTNFEPVWLKAAGQLGHAILDHFADPRGGFFQTADDAEVLLLRPKELFDNAVPAGNSVAADVLLRLGRLCEDAKFERAGVSALRVVRDLMLKVPPAFGYALAALSFYVRPTREIAIIGDPDAAATRQMLRQIQIRYLPQMVVAAAPASDPESTALVPLLNGREKVDGMSTVFLCERYVCKLPITTPQDLSLALGPSPMPD